MPTIITRGGASAKAFGFTGGGAAGPGSISYTTSGTYTWIAPSGVTSVSVVAVGAGGGGSSGFPGSGGGLGYKNNYSVTPGNSYTVVVGASVTGGNGGYSYFMSTCVVKGGGGLFGINKSGGTPVSYTHLTLPTILRV